jgi:hypothetical protein
MKLLLILLIIFIVIFLLTDVRRKKVFIETVNYIGRPNDGKNRWNSDALAKHNLPFDSLTITRSGKMIVTIKVSINKEQLEKILKYSTFSYEKDVLYVKCDNIGVAVAAFLFATDVLLDNPDDYNTLVNSINIAYKESNDAEFNDMLNNYLAKLNDNISKLFNSSSTLSSTPSIYPSTLISLSTLKPVSNMSNSLPKYSKHTQPYIHTKNQRYVVQQKYLDDTVIDGKNYTLGYPSTFAGCKS